MKKKYGERSVSYVFCNNCGVAECNNVGMNTGSYCEVYVPAKIKPKKKINYRADFISGIANNPKHKRYIKEKLNEKIIYS
jgi:hypothetical protein